MVLLTGCAGYRGINTHAEMNGAPDSLGVSTDVNGVWPASGWWHSFNDPQLDSLIEETLAGNPSLKEADARIRLALAAAGAARSSQMPDVSAGASGIYQRFPEHGTYPPQFAGEWDSVNDLSVNLSYSLDLWGKNKAEFESAVGAVRAAEIDRKAAELSLSYAVAETYIKLALVSEQTDVREKLLAKFEKLDGLQKIRYDAGLDPEYKVKYTESAVAAAKADITALKEQQELLKNRLGALTGKGPQRGADISSPVLKVSGGLTLPSDIPAQLIGRRPDIAAQKWRIESMSRSIKAAKADFYPNVNLTAFAGLSAIGLDNIFKSGSTVAGFGPAVSLPIFNGHLLESRLAAQNAKYDEAVERYNTLIVKAVQEVADTVVSWRKTETLLTERGEVLAKLKEANALALKSYEGGIIDSTPVIKAEMDILAEEAKQNDIRSRQAEITVALIKALGGGFEPVSPAEKK